MRRTLAEDLLLLAFHDEQGTVVRPARTDVLPFAYAAGLMMDLALLGKTQEVDGLLQVTDPTPTDDPLFDSTVKRILESDQRLSLAEWLSRLARATPDLEQQLLERLVSKGILRREEKKILWIFSKTHHPMQDADHERSIRDDIRRVLLAGESADARTKVLVSLIYTINLTPEIFPDAREEELAREKAKLIADALPHSEAIS